VFVAATVGARDRLAALLKDKPGLVKLRNGEGLNPLHVAAREGHGEAVRILLAAGADMKALDDHPQEGVFRPYTNGWTPLHLAAMAGNKAAAAILLQHGADANAADQRGKHTPLHFAALAGSADLVRLLLSHRADSDAEDDKHRTPLDLAEERGHTAVINLLKKDAKSGSMSGGSFRVSSGPSANHGRPSDACGETKRRRGRLSS
jgi:ankyrin repeat protein